MRVWTQKVPTKLMKERRQNGRQQQRIWNRRQIAPICQYLQWRKTANTGEIVETMNSDDEGLTDPADIEERIVTMTGPWQWWFHWRQWWRWWCVSWWRQQWSHWYGPQLWHQHNQYKCNRWDSWICLPKKYRKSSCLGTGYMNLQYAKMMARMIHPGWRTLYSMRCFERIGNW